MNNIGYRIFVIGAGFSVPAGLPTAAELYGLVKSRIELVYGTDTKFHRSLDEFIDYKRSTCNVTLTHDEVDLEEFMSFLDIEHYLWLEGSDTLSSKGNGAQLLIKKFIGQIIHERTPVASNLPQEYIEFAQNLKTTDVIITLNYDVILERALDFVGKPYRLFAHRFKSTHDYVGTIDDNKEEVVILKLHGSLDWFSNEDYLGSIAAFKKQNYHELPIDPIFNNGNKYAPIPLVDGSRTADDPLEFIHRLSNLDSFYKNFDPPGVPMILSPSHMKIVYANPFISFWHGLGRLGGYNLGINIIGFSLPEHDDYLRVCLYKMIKNYQCFQWDFTLNGIEKDNVKIVDYRVTDKAIEQLKQTYSFIDEQKSAFYFKGFSVDAVKFLFD